MTSNVFSFQIRYILDVNFPVSPPLNKLFYAEEEFALLLIPDGDVACLGKYTFAPRQQCCFIEPVVIHDILLINSDLFDRLCANADGYEGRY